MNEPIFILHASLTSFCALIALAIGKEALVGLITAYSILANLFVVKQITLFDWQATASDAFAIGAALGFNMLNEYYGRQTAMKTLYAAFFACICYALFSKIHLVYIPSSFDQCHAAFCSILKTTPRIITASLIAYGISQYLENHFYSLLKRVTHGSHFLLRNVITIPLCQLIDTLLFTYLGLYGTLSHIGAIAAVSYSIKLIALAIAVPSLWLTKKVKPS